MSRPQPPETMSGWGVDTELLGTRGQITNGTLNPAEMMMKPARVMKKGAGCTDICLLSFTSERKLH